MTGSEIAPAVSRRIHLSHTICPASTAFCYRGRRRYRHPRHRSPDGGERVTTFEITGVVQPGEARSYRMIPFTVPPGARRIALTYTYDGASGAPGAQTGNTIDIGIFDPRGPDGRGFRGWSGSRRSAFTLTERDATPGYVPGPIPAGAWHIVLGLYEIASGGCRYAITVTLDGHAAQLPPPIPAVGEALDQLSDARSSALPGWLRGDLHCHSEHSDGDASLRDILATARALGLDFLAVTDHNTTSHHAALRALAPAAESDRLILIPGVEVTTYFGHANVWGLPDRFVDFRCRTPEEMTVALAGAVRSGGLASINHPKPQGPPWEFGLLAPFSCVEIWNGPWPWFNPSALAYADAVLRTGRRIVFVGGSDMHHYHPPRIPRLARPTTWVYAPGATGAADLLHAIGMGHLFISRDPRGPQVILTSDDARAGDTLPRPEHGRVPVRVQVRGAAGMTIQVVTEYGIVGTLPVEGDDRTYEVRVDLGAAWTLRAQVMDGPTALEGVDLLAITNPLFFRA